MGDLEGAPAVHINFPLLSFYLCTTFKTGIAAAGEPIPSEYGRFGDCVQQLAETLCLHLQLAVQTVQWNWICRLGRYLMMEGGLSKGRRGSWGRNWDRSREGIWTGFDS